MSVTRTFLDLSTAHLPEHLGSFNSEGNLTEWRASGGSRFTIYKHDEYGFFIHVPNEQDMVDFGYEDAPPELRVIWERARTLGCDYVLFDRDADIDDNLPTWEW